MIEDSGVSNSGSAPSGNSTDLVDVVVRKISMLEKRIGKFLEKSTSSPSVNPFFVVSNRLASEKEAVPTYPHYTAHQALDFFQSTGQMIENIPASLSGDLKSNLGEKEVSRIDNTVTRLLEIVSETSTRIQKFVTSAVTPASAQPSGDQGVASAPTDSGLETFSNGKDHEENGAGLQPVNDVVLPADKGQAEAMASDEDGATSPVVGDDRAQDVDVSHLAAPHDTLTGAGAGVTEDDILAAAKLVVDSVHPIPVQEPVVTDFSAGTPKPLPQVSFDVKDANGAIRDDSLGTPDPLTPVVQAPAKPGNRDEADVQANIGDGITVPGDMHAAATIARTHSGPLTDDDIKQILSGIPEREPDPDSQTDAQKVIDKNKNGMLRRAFASVGRQLTLPALKQRALNTFNFYKSNWDATLIGLVVGYVVKPMLVPIVVSFVAAATATTGHEWIAIPAAGLVAGAVSGSLTKIIVQGTNHFLKGAKLEQGWAWKAVKDGALAGATGGVIGASIAEYLPWNTVKTFFGTHLFGLSASGAANAGSSLALAPGGAGHVPSLHGGATPPTNNVPTANNGAPFKVSSALPVPDASDASNVQASGASGAAGDTSSVLDATREVVKSLSTSDRLDGLSTLKGVVASALKLKTSGAYAHALKEVSGWFMNGHHNATEKAFGASMAEQGRELVDNLNLHTATANQLRTDDAYLKFWGLYGVVKDRIVSFDLAHRAGHVGRKFLSQVARYSLAKPTAG